MENEQRIFMQSVIKQCSNFFLGLHKYCEEYSSNFATGEKPAKESGSGLSSTHGKMSNQLTQLKSMLVGMKGNMADTKKKPTEGSTGAKPSTSTSKSRNNLLVNSSSAGKMNSSLDHGRIGQKSIEPKRPGKLGTGDGVNDFLHRTLAHLLPW